MVVYSSKMSKMWLLCYRAKFLSTKSEATLDVLRPVFEDRIISHRADVSWSPRWCDLTIFCIVPSKISVTPTIQGNFSLWRKMFYWPNLYMDWLLKNGAVKDKCYAQKRSSNCTQSIMCLKIALHGQSRQPFE